MSKGGKKYHFLWLLLVLSVLIIQQVPRGMAEESHLASVLYINVGRADAILVMLDNRNYLIDTGSKSSVPKLLGAMNLMNIKRIDAVFLTHTHTDHIGGIEALAEHCEIERIYSSVITRPAKNDENKIAETASSLGLPHMLLSLGDTLPAGNGLQFDVLGPLKMDEEEDNNNSLVLRLHVNGQTLLFAGDMEYMEEYTLLTGGTDLSATVLKVGNHGNSDATSSSFASAVSPDIAVISTNTSEDPDSASPIVISNLSAAAVYVTEDYPVGILIDIGVDGGTGVFSPEAKAAPADVRIQAISTSSQTALFINDGETADLSGYMFLSDKGKELFLFPENTMLEAGETLILACEGRQGDIVWEGEKKAWNAKGPDNGILYDRYGRELDRFTAGD